jgi:KDO2-lipid IV(A) lauroyltransferase
MAIAAPARLFQLLASLPLPLLHRLGALAGWLAYAMSPRYRRQLQQNLRLCCDGDDYLRVLPRAVAESGKMALELPKLWVPPLPQVVAMVGQVDGWQHFEAAWACGEGVLLIMPHLGCFDMLGQYMATKAPMTALYRPAKQAWLRPIVDAGRKRPTLTMVPTDLSGVRRLLKALRRRETVGILPDQAPSAGEGVWLPFFSKPAYTMTLAARLTESGSVTAIVGFAERLPGGRGYHLHFVPVGEALVGDTAARAAVINRAVEAMIRHCPEQYLWGYNRYKSPAGAESPPPPVQC